MNPSETVIVIRSLVPGGVAQQDGRLVPGDRLMFVNEANLENASLDQAVQALKGAPRGTVHIGVAKPYPLPDIGESSTDDYVSVTQLTCCFMGSCFWYQAIFWLVFIICGFVGILCCYSDCTFAEFTNLPYPVYTARGRRAS